jgi:hypothetical protein
MRTRRRTFDPDAVLAAYLHDPAVCRPTSKLGDVVATAAWTRAFCAAVMDSYSEQQLHRGLRANYGLTATDARYARCVSAWADYTARYATWAAEPAHRRAAAATELTDAQHAVLATRPARPAEPDPRSMATPADWPAQIDGLSEVTARFFAARRP